jgi:hypothetical protein
MVGRIVFSAHRRRRKDKNGLRKEQSCKEYKELLYGKKKIQMELKSVDIIHEHKMEAVATRLKRTKIKNMQRKRKIVCIIH